jgi:hypothetical protein
VVTHGTNTIPLASFLMSSCKREQALAVIEAPWVPAPATVAGRWRARRLNNACWGVRSRGCTGREAGTSTISATMASDLRRRLRGGLWLDQRLTITLASLAPLSLLLCLA